MLKYILLMEKNLISQAIFKWQFVSSCFNVLIEILLFYYIWGAVFSERATIGTFNFGEFVTYLFLSRTIGLLLRSRTMMNIAVGIRTGSIGYELIRPLNYYFSKLFETLGEIVIPSIIYSGIMLLVGFSMFKIQLPVSPLALVLALINLFLGCILMFHIDYLLGLLAFWTRGFYGIKAVKLALFGILSGSLIPIDFFTSGVKNVLMLLPFHTMVNLPVSVYLGKISLHEGLGWTGIQLMWVMVLYLIVSVFWGKAIKKVVINGG